MAKGIKMSAKISFSKVYFYAQSLLDNTYKLTTRVHGTQRILEYTSSTAKQRIILVDGKFVEIDLESSGFYFRFTAELIDENNFTCAALRRNRRTDVTTVCTTQFATFWNGLRLLLG